MRKRCGCREPGPLADVLALSEMELERWAALQEELRASGTPLAMPDWPASLIATPLGFLDILGHSGIADYKGVTQPDFGAAHRLDQELQPALYRNIAMGSAIHSWHDQGNAALGDGGWAHAATEFDRGEEVAGFMATTLNGRRWRTPQALSSPPPVWRGPWTIWLSARAPPPRSFRSRAPT